MTSELREHRIRVQRSARWYELGEPSPAVQEIWLVVHGYGQLARDFIETFTPIATPERLIVAPEALSRFYTTTERGTGHRQTPVGATWMTREDREAEILDYVDYLDAVITRAKAAAPNARRVVAFGFSQGTATVSRWASHGSDAPDRLILWGGTPAEDIVPVQLQERLGGTPVEIVHGRHDRVVPLASVELAVERLRVSGLPVDFQEYDGGHGIDAGVLAGVASRIAAAGRQSRG